MSLSGVVCSEDSVGTVLFAELNLWSKALDLLRLLQGHERGQFSLMIKSWLSPSVRRVACDVTQQC